MKAPNAPRRTARAVACFAFCAALFSAGLLAGLTLADARAQQAGGDALDMEKLTRNFTSVVYAITELAIATETNAIEVNELNDRVGRLEALLNERDK